MRLLNELPTFPFVAVYFKHQSTFIHTENILAVLLKFKLNPIISENPTSGNWATNSHPYPRAGLQAGDNFTYPYESVCQYSLVNCHPYLCVGDCCQKSLI